MDPLVTAGIGGEVEAAHGGVEPDPHRGAGHQTVPPALPLERVPEWDGGGRRGMSYAGIVLLH